MNNKRRITIKDGYGKMDFTRIEKMLSKSYWSPGIKKSEITKGAKNSELVVGVFDADGIQIGYARVISDLTRFAYIMDVFVDQAHRGKGIGQKMIKYILSHPKMKDVYQWLLITKDARGFYKKIGFKPTSRPQDWMEIRHKRPKR